MRIVDIDEPSLAKVGQWPWPRTKLAAIIDALKAAGARTITLDLILAGEPDRLSPGEFPKLRFGEDQVERDGACAGRLQGIGMAATWCAAGPLADLGERRLVDVDDPSG